MTTKIKFTKMHGAGNDYIYVDTTRYPIAAPEKKAIEWSKFHTGIGSDGLILIGSSDKADFSMRIFNADGSEAMMCGNGSRCVGKYVYEYGLTAKKEITLDTRSGIKVLKLHVERGKVTAVTVDMGSPLETEAVDFGDQFPFQSTRVSMGNPHLVTFVEDITQINLPEIGPQLENYHLFPDRTNVEFAQIVGKDTIRMRVWERGSGITQACGTGACATAVAAVLHGLAGRKCDIIMDGGTVTIEWEEAMGHILMTGPATKVFDGEMEG
ncbi:diaminopimelate epimerase [Bacteroides thetaiotaomicron]|uniref:diaminopimelate epimerase n=1 Tax=Bacteroides thetaiotaomicron TaxID=818 RepID=UPI0018AB08CC|nr:diaminopimelate epimerase [Bacteroides thetaiotaomicron]MDC2164032.1 diaminopimelate epimerase [Bacteroides thetaiotaomicron]